MSQYLVKICVDGPVWSLYDYAMPVDSSESTYQAGSRVRVPFGRGSRLGIIMEGPLSDSGQAREFTIKDVDCVFDDQPILSPPLISLYKWVSDYYHYPLGSVIFNTLPKLIRQGKPIVLPVREIIQINKSMQSVSDTLLKRAKKQQQLYSYIISSTDDVTKESLASQGYSNQTLKSLLEKELVVSIIDNNPIAEEQYVNKVDMQLTQHQQQAINAINKKDSFHTFLLAGVTGSGKTEVYLRAIAHIIEQGKQALVLVPEISLTPQTLKRFSKRFNIAIVMLHSGLNDTERMQAWGQAQQGEAKIIIGTRSAIFVPLPLLGIIVLDEEHDQSFSQQSGLRYSARDIAIKRAHIESVPVVLGSATPSIESLYNVQKNKFTQLNLPDRVATSGRAKVSVIDLRQQKREAGLSPLLIDKIQHHLNQKGQVLLFLNRRGYAPVLMCHSCGWIAQCRHCDARMTWHESRQRLVCHHCCAEVFAQRICSDCKQEELDKVGVGTQRLESALAHHFPDHSVLRVDRDSTRRKGALVNLLESIHDQRADIIVGTQMIAKGHHFPNLTLVALVDADTGLLGSDFRSLERMGQMYVQVAGRAGRESRQGEIVIQTHQPEHPLLQLLLSGGYFKFVEQIMQERSVMSLPPYTSMALFRAEAAQQDKSLQFLSTVKDLAEQYNCAVQVMGPIAAPMQKRAGMYRSQLLLRADARKELHGLLRAVIPRINKLKEGQRMRWSLDVDPQELF